MKKSSAIKLNQINQDFYEEVAESFDTSRNFFWSGWENLITSLKDLTAKNPLKPLKVLDLGCGNGRFAKWLDESSIQSEYLGVDTNSFLLNTAKKSTSKLRNVAVSFQKNDFIKDLINEKNKLNIGSSFDLIVCFGVIHHIPGSLNRKNFIRILKKQLSKNGLIIVTTWNFSNIPSLMNRAQKLLERKIISDAEPEDYLLDWKRKPSQKINSKDSNSQRKAHRNHFRYCHLVSTQEANSWWSSAGLILMLHYTADGPQNKSNHYFIVAHDLVEHSRFD
jgi:tRNA (uracil-5-)-methyltransferase TRM9